MTDLRRVGLMFEMRWPYRRHLDLFVGAQRYAAEHGGWECVVDEFAHASLRRSSRRNRPYDGLLARATHELARQARRLRIPLVNVWFNSPACDVPGVFCDFAATGRLAAEHLLARGFHRFACLAARRDRVHGEQLAAFHAEIDAAGGACRCIKSTHSHDRSANAWHAFGRMVDRWIDGWSPPIGVFVAFNDVTGRYVANACRARGLRIPDDVALIAGLNEPVLFEHPQPSITSIEVAYEGVGYEAARLLDGLMDGGAAPKGPLLLPPVGVVARDSTDFMAVDDALVDAAIRFIAGHSHQRIAVADVVRAVHASRRTLERRFGACLGRPVAAEIRRLRIERAKRHLAGGQLAIKTVAVRCGFANAQRLSEAFRRSEGLAPREYRRRMLPTQR